MSNLPPGTTLADIDAHFGPPRCQVLVGDERHDDVECGIPAEDFACAICREPLCDVHAEFGDSSTCPHCQREVDEAMEEFSFLRIEQMLRSGRVALRKLARKATIVEAQTVAQQIDQLSNIINTLMEIRCGGHDDGR